MLKFQQHCLHFGPFKFLVPEKCDEITTFPLETCKRPICQISGEFSRLFLLGMGLSLPANGLTLMGKGAIFEKKYFSEIDFFALIMKQKCSNLTFYCEYLTHLQPTMMPMVVAVCGLVTSASREHDGNHRTQFPQPLEVSHGFLATKPSSSMVWLKALITFLPQFLHL